MDILKVSFIIPTYNAEKYLEQCLKSIFNQDYPSDRIEVFIVDGGSEDKTLEIAAKFNVNVLKNPRRIAEYGKFIAFKQSSGVVIALLDSDNVIASKDWLKRMMYPISQDPKILGSESNYLIAKDFTSINTYLNLLIIADPLARMIASRPKLIKSGRFNLKKYNIGDVPVSGANGFLWRREKIEQYLEGHDTFEEGNLLSRIAKSEKVYIANIPGLGIYHYYCISLKDYVNKRKKIASKFLGRKKKKIQTWVDSVNNFWFFISIIYLSTLLGPMIESLFNFVRSGRREWFWHPIVCLITVTVYLRSFLNYYARKFF
ncbi:MAG TPA: glycosyltransferase [Verrucomicrobiae bacterium]|nr:glycosyltransferase [Verrucomicrobiae bacterium]